MSNHEVAHRPRRRLDRAGTCGPAPSSAAGRPRRLTSLRAKRAQCHAFGVGARELAFEQIDEGGQGVAGRQDADHLLSVEHDGRPHPPRRARACEDPPAGQEMNSRCLGCRHPRRPGTWPPTGRAIGTSASDIAHPPRVGPPRSRDGSPPWRERCRRRREKRAPRVGRTRSSACGARRRRGFARRRLDGRAPWRGLPRLPGCAWARTRGRPHGRAPRHVPLSTTAPVVPPATAETHSASGLLGSRRSCTGSRA